MKPVLRRTPQAITLLWAMACGATTPESKTSESSLQNSHIPEGPAVGLTVQSAELATHIEQWFVPGELSLEQGTTLLVFWEIWCPHCRTHMPLLNDTLDAFETKGLKIVALTPLTGSSSNEAQVEAFIAENELRYPIAKENGAISDQFQVEGVPNAAVVQNGQVIWNQHPGYLTHEVLGEML